MRHWSSSPAIRTQAADQKPTPGRAGSTSSTAWTARIRPSPCAIELPGRSAPEGLVSLSDAAAATAALLRQLSEAQWDAATDGWPFEVSVRVATLHLLHDLEHHVWDVRRGYAKLALADGIEVATSSR